MVLITFVDKANNSLSVSVFTFNKIIDEVERKKSISVAEINIPILPGQDISIYGSYTRNILNFKSKIII